MTDIQDNNASAIDDTISPLEGQAIDTAEVQAETPEVEQEIFDFAEVGDKFVKLQVDGQEVTVPIKEALAGYQRQADYTRKTQELSEQKKQLQYAAALQEALQNNPAETVKLLQQQLGLDIQPEEEDVWVDPATAAVKDLEKRLIAFEQKQAMDELSRTIDSLTSKYGNDFDADEVVSKALAIGSNDLEAVFKQIAFDKIYSKASEANKKLADEQARLDAKRGQAGLVTSATSSKATAVPKPAQPKTVQEAYEAAKKILGE
jgi:hypothetical protein